MPQGAFNVSRLLRELGLKNIIEMPVRTEIQPTINLDSMAGQIPVHVGGVAIMGGKAQANALEASAFKLTCRDPGGGILMSIQRGASSILRMDLFDGASQTAWGAAGPVPMKVLNFTNNPTRSILESGSWAVTAGADAIEIAQFVGAPDYAPLYIPPGGVLELSGNVVNSSRTLTLLYCGITATEADPA
jgi:hypothetical protein